MTVLNETAVNVSWKALTIPYFSVTSYTIMYSRLSQENEEISVEIFPPDTFSVIFAPTSKHIYKFEVFATATVDGKSLEGERSNSVYLTRPRKNILCICIPVVLSFIPILYCTHP